MVCVYCGSETQVINSRAQKRNNQVWRRRQCLKCKAVFTTHESTHLPSLFAVSSNSSKGKVTPFIPDKLFAEILITLQPRTNVYEAAREITSTVTHNLIKNAAEGLILAQNISLETSRVLKRFDKQAYLRYMAEHPSLHI